MAEVDKLVVVAVVVEVEAPLPAMLLLLAVAAAVELQLVAVPDEGVVLPAGTVMLDEAAPLADDGEGGISGGVVALSLIGCSSEETDGGLLEGVPMGPLELKLGDGLGADTIPAATFPVALTFIVLELAFPVPVPATNAASKVPPVGVAGI